jgi:hypothetical protein
MSGAVAGAISIAALLVGATIIATLVKNPSGTGTLINSVFTGFNNSLIAAQGNVTSLSPNTSTY